MQELSVTDLKIINEICGREYMNRYKAFIKNKKENILKVVNTGMVSSGKSSLFNVLIDSNENEHFPTGAARTTTVVNYYDYKNISFIDTPGIDVKTEDDTLAFDTILEADVIIFVHNIKTGPLNRSEVEWIKRIANNIKDIELRRQKFILVCSWKDARENEEGYQEIIQEVRNQVFQIMDTEVPYFEVSVKKYLNGVTKEKEVLIRKSGIMELKNYLDDFSAKYLLEKREMIEKEEKLLIFDIRDVLQRESQSRKADTNNKKEKIKNAYKSRYSAWKQVHTLFSSKRKHLKSLEEEYNNI